MSFGMTGIYASPSGMRVSEAAERQSQLHTDRLAGVALDVPAKALGVIDDTQCFAPILNDSLANLMKSLVKHRGCMVRRIALRNFCREELFGSALKVFVYPFLVVRHLQPPRFAGDVLSG
jgi:hypothetical protein